MVVGCGNVDRIGLVVNRKSVGCSSLYIGSAMPFIPLGLLVG